MKKLLNLADYKPDPGVITDREGNEFIISPHIPRKIISLQSEIAKIDVEKDIDALYDKSNELIREVLYIEKSNDRAKVDAFIKSLDVTDGRLVAEAMSEYMVEVMQGEKKKNSKTSSQPSPTSTEQ